MEYMKRERNTERSTEIILPFLGFARSHVSVTVTPAGQSAVPDIRCKCLPGSLSASERRWCSEARIR